MKIKINSSIKKRFLLTKYKNVKSCQSNKRHNMVNKKNRQIRRQRGMKIIIINALIPNNSK